jgi:putative methyltransferase (TIGR04325 family)
MNLKQLLKDLIPPILFKAIRTGQERKAVFSDRPEWEYLPEGWEAEGKDARIKGWNVEAVLEAYKAKWEGFLKTVEGTGPFGLSPEAVTGVGSADLSYHNSVMIYGYCLALASRGKGAFSMLDWGGGIGHYFLIAKALLPNVRVEYHCKDVPVLANHGKTLLPEAHFHVDESCLSRRYDFVMASTSLHYSREWEETLKKLAGATGMHLLVTGLPVVFHAPSFVFVQRPYQYGYNTEYVGWCLNRGEFLDCARSAGLTLDREFVVGYQPLIAGAPEQCQYRGYFFRV